MEEYHNPAPSNTLKARRYRGISYVRPIDAAKQAVPCIDLADRLTGPGGLRKVGEHWTARCPLPDHEDKTPSFVVYPETDSFFCYGCLRGGDVVELARYAWGYDQRDAHVAAANLLHEFGHEIPKRSPAAERKQDRQENIRAVVDAQKIEHIRMLVFRLIWVPWLKDLPPWTRDEAKASAWESSRDIAKLLYEQRRAA